MKDYGGGEVAGSKLLPHAPVKRWPHNSHHSAPAHGHPLIATFIGVLITFAMWVSLWENVWQASVEPTRGAIYDARLIALALRRTFARRGGGGGRRGVG